MDSINTIKSQFCCPDLSRAVVRSGGLGSGRTGRDQPTLDPGAWMENALCADVVRRFKRRLKDTGQVEKWMRPETGFDHTAGLHKRSLGKKGPTCILPSTWNQPLTTGSDWSGGSKRFRFPLALPCFH